jgi:hypothetical protein
MRAHVWLPVLVLVGAARPVGASNIRLTIVSAKIDGSKIAKHDHPTSNAHLSDLACLSLPGLRAIPSLCGSNGEPTGAVKNGAPVDAMVRIEIGEHVIRTYAMPGTLTPRWDYGVVLDRAFLDNGEFANFIVYDFDGPGAEKKLGDKLVKNRELLKPGLHTLKGVGAAELTYKVEALPDGATARSYKFRVPADQQMADLARNAKTEGAGYVVIPVAEGELVDVTASGQIQPNAKKHPERVAGPNGIPTIQTKIQFNQPGFRGCAGCDHAALIGQIGSKGLVIGAKKQFAVENAGLLVLAINDLKTSDNAGGFDVQVTVSMPGASASGPRAPSTKKGSAGDSGPAGIDPRLVQQIVDSHGAELDACVANEANPFGEVILQFAISADGSLLGVTVEKASQNLKSAGDCMRKKALAWRFPPPRGVVTARYPVSFSPG